MSHQTHFFKGAQDKKKSKNNLCLKCSKFENRLRVCSEESKMLAREKYLKKIKNMRFFRGSHFVFGGWWNVDFSIFYFGFGSAYLKLPIQVEVEFWLSITMRPLGAPRPPATIISSRHSAKNSSSIFFIFLCVVRDITCYNIGYVSMNRILAFLNETGNSFHMLFFENFKVVIKKWNLYHGQAAQIHIWK